MDVSDDGANCSIVVVNERDDKKYKMVIRGGIHKITIAKLKTYLAQACGMEPAAQILRFGDNDLADGMTGHDCGLAPNVTLHLRPRGAGHVTPQRLTPRQPQPTALPPTREGSLLQPDLVGRQRQLELLSNETPMRTPVRSVPEVGVPLAAAPSLVSSAPPTQTMAQRNLQEFSSHLGCRPALTFDANQTCVVNVEERYTLLITFDAITERMFLYTTLLTRLPADTGRRLRLYETILEGAVLGREMAGGGVGVNQANGLVIMSSSIDLRHSDATALRDLVPTFAECAVRWKKVVSEI